MDEDYTTNVKLEEIMINDIHIGPLTIHLYGIMVAIGYMSALIISEKRARKQGLNPDILFGIFWCAVLGGAAGSKLLYYTVGYCRYKKVDFLSYLDLVLPAVAFAQGCGRIGCFFAGCCYGRETDSLFSIQYWQSDYAPNGVKLIPTQIYSSIGDFAMAFLLMAYAKKKPKKGKISAVYCILYSIGRFVIEMLRNDYRGTFGFLSTSQLISIFILILGISMFLWAEKHAGKDEKEWTGI